MIWYSIVVSRKLSFVPLYLLHRTLPSGRTRKFGSVSPITGLTYNETRKCSSQTSHDVTATIVPWTRWIVPAAVTPIACGIAFLEGTSDMTAWAIYREPDRYLCRRFNVSPSGRVTAHEIHAVPTLGEARAFAPAGSTRYDRHEGDEPALVETWVCVGVTA